MHAILNIGLAVGDAGQSISASQALAALRLSGGDVSHAEVRQSNTEATLVATVREPLLPDALYALAVTLSQEAIAQHDGTAGELYGPGAEAWRPFNPDYFLAPLQEAVAA